LKSWKAPSVRKDVIVWTLLGIVGLALIGRTSVNTARVLQQVNSARSDNVQWTLSQVEVEFLEYQLDLELWADSSAGDFGAITRDFDILFSRIETFRVASIYAPMRVEADFETPLGDLKIFLTDSADIIDAGGETRNEDVPKLLMLAQTARPLVRALSNSGLEHFAHEADRMRAKVSNTMLQMAASVVFSILILAVFALYLGRLNRQNLLRKREVIEASHRMSVVTSTSLDAVIVTDARGVILDFNVAAEQIFGYNAAVAGGKNLNMLLVPDDFVAAHAAGMQIQSEMNEGLFTGKGRFRLEARRANGEIFPAEMALQSASTAEGEVFIAFLRDISHRVRAEQDLVAARDRALAGEKAKTDFLATMSHEIRTPLNGLLGNLSLLTDTQVSPQQMRYIDNMETSGRLLMSHISDVLDITKYDAGKLTLRPAPMNLSALLQNIVDNQGGAAAARNISVDWSWIGAPTDWIYADGERIQHILLNVIGNAVKFTRVGSVDITLETLSSDTEIEIVVRDTGIGMDEALQARIFDDFTTGNASYDRDVGGTGLGLGIAQRFVAALGGTIKVESTENVGTTFSIRFPITPIAPPKRKLSKSTAADERISRSVLVVEDNPINRVVAREMLRAAGHIVTEAYNGREAVALAYTHPFDLILMDISMPILDGRGATREIRAGQGHCAKTPIVALTANAMQEEQVAYLSDGMTDVLTKPLSRAALIGIVARLGAESDHPSVPFVDLSCLQDLRQALGPNAVDILVQRFKKELEQAFADLAALAPNDLTGVTRRSREIAAKAAYFGAVQLQNLLAFVEAAAERGDQVAVDATIAILPRVWATSAPMYDSEN
jgi:PAS domain S-box-containing protein